MPNTTEIQKPSLDVSKKLNAGSASTKELIDPKVQEELNKKQKEIMKKIVKKLPKDQAEKVQAIFENPGNKEWVDQNIGQIAKLQLEAVKNAKLNKKDGIKSKDVGDIDKVYATHQGRYLNMKDLFSDAGEKYTKDFSIDLAQAPSVKNPEKNQEILLTKHMEKNLKKVENLVKDDLKLAEVLMKYPEWKEVIIQQIGDMDLDSIQIEKDGSVKIIDKADNNTIYNAGVGIRNTLRVFGHIVKSLGNPDFYNKSINKISRSLTGHDAVVVCPHLDLLSLESKKGSKDRMMSISSETFARKIPQVDEIKKTIATVEFEGTPAKAFSKGGYEFTQEFLGSVQKDANTLNMYVQRLKENKLDVPVFSIAVKAGIDSQNYDPTISPERTNLLVQEYDNLKSIMQQKYPQEYKNLVDKIAFQASVRNQYDQKLLFVRAAKPFMELVSKLNANVKVTPQFDIIVGTSKDKVVMAQDRKVDITFEGPKKVLEYSYKVEREPLEQEKTVVHIGSKTIDTGWQTKSGDYPVLATTP